MDLDQPEIEGRGLETRVTRLENDMRDVRAILLRLEPMIVRIDATMPFLATKHELADLKATLTHDFAVRRAQTKADLAAHRTEVNADLAEFRFETKADMAALRFELKEDISAFRLEVKDEFGKVRQELAAKASTFGMWAMGISLMTLVVGAMPTGAIYVPFLFRVMHVPPP